MTIYSLSEKFSITEILNKCKISQNKHAILAHNIILKSGVVHNRNELCYDMCSDVIMSKHCGIPPFYVHKAKYRCFCNIYGIV